MSLQFKDQFGRHDVVMARAMIQHYHNNVATSVPVVDPRSGEDNTMKEVSQNKCLLADEPYEVTEFCSDSVLATCHFFEFSNLREFIAEQEGATLERTALGQDNFVYYYDDDSMASSDSQDSISLARRRWLVFGKRVVAAPRRIIDHASGQFVKLK